MISVWEASESLEALREMELRVPRGAETMEAIMEEGVFLGRT